MNDVFHLHNWSANICLLFRTRKIFATVPCVLMRFLELYLFPLLIYPPKPATLALATALVRARAPNDSYPSFSPLPSWLCRSFAHAPPKEMNLEEFATIVVTCLMHPEEPTKGYLTIIPRVRVGYEMADSRRGA